MRMVVRFKAEKIVASSQAMSLTVPTTHFAGGSDLTGITLADGNSGRCWCWSRLNTFLTLAAELL